MSRRHAGSLSLLLLVLLIAAPACKKKTPDTTGPAQPATTDDAVPSRADDPVDDRDDTVYDTFGTDDTTADDIAMRDEDPDDIARTYLRNVYFGYDRHDLTSDSRATLAENAAWLKAHDEWQVLVNGHCDERGTIEYNLALGEKRANSVRDYLADLGVDRSRIRIVTYGEEQPAALGHNESAWSQNRRAEFGLEH